MAGTSIQEVAKTLEEIGAEAINWGQRNKVEFEPSKTEAVLFSRSRKAQRKARETTTTIWFGEEQISFQKEATKWLGFWLDYSLNFQEHFKKKLAKATQVLNQTRTLSKRKGLALGLVRKLQLAAVNTIALYGVEIWWKNQKNRRDQLQLLLNKQARAIIGMFKTTPLKLLQREAGLLNAEDLLNYRQQCYALRALSRPTGHPTNTILPPTFRYGELDAQPGQFSSRNLD